MMTGNKTQTRPGAGGFSLEWVERLSRRMRARRFAQFAALAERFPKPLTILDVGGRNTYWEVHGWAGRTDVRITLANTESQEKRHPNIIPVHADATSMRCFADHDFDIVFSNSVIEHLFTWENQQAMAREVRRVGKAYWVQTPNYWFPLEPHFRFVGWHWLPVRMRIALLQRRGFGLRGSCRDREHASRIIREIRLLTRSELAALFPESRIVSERFMGLTKSWVAIAGLPDKRFPEATGARCHSAAV